jgi:hypothetical protein
MQPTSSATATEVEKSVHQGKRNRPKSILSRILRPVRRFYRYSTLRIALRELCRLPHRIGWVSRIEEVELLLGPGSIETHKWLNEALIPDPESRQSNCIAYIRRIRTLHPFLSTFDIHLLEKTWIAGSEWNTRNADIRRSPENPANLEL